MQRAISLNNESRNNGPGSLVESPGLTLSIPSPDGTMTRQELEAQLGIYEKMYAMSSAVFYESWRQGQAPDTFETSDWATLYEYQQRGYGL